MAEILMEDVGTLPKELLAFIERKAERAIEVLREIVTEPENEPFQSPLMAAGQAGGLGQFLGGGQLNQFANQQAMQAPWPPTTVIGDYRG